MTKNVVLCDGKDMKPMHESMLEEVFPIHALEDQCLSSDLTSDVITTALEVKHIEKDWYYFISLSDRLRSGLVFFGGVIDMKKRPFTITLRNLGQQQIGIKKGELIAELVFCKRPGKAFE